MKHKKNKKKVIMQVCSSLLQNLCAVKWSNYILDIVALLIIIGYTIICARRGFIECLFSFITLILSIVLAVSFAKPALSMTNGLFGLQDKWTESFVQSFSKVEAFAMDVSTDGLKQILAEQNAPEVLIDLVMKWVGSVDTLPAGTTIAMVLGEVTAKLLSLLVCGLVIFIVSFIVLFCLKKILSAIIKGLVLLGVVNSILGAVIGIIQALLIICGILAVVTLIPSAAIEEYLSNTLFLGFLYENNLLIKCFGLLL